MHNKYDDRKSVIVSFTVIVPRKSVIVTSLTAALISCFPCWDRRDFVRLCPPLCLTLCSSCGNTGHECDFSWPMYLRCLWGHVQNRQGQLTGFSLFNLQVYTSLVHFIYSHYRLVPSATQGPVETLTHSHTLLELARLHALLYLSTIGSLRDNVRPSAPSE